ncbi:MAG: hypothetical protein ACOZCO_14125 [Bacteroidota bacterium]
MRKIILAMMIFTSGASSCQLLAQDTIIKMNGDEIEAKIIEINTTEIKYKKHSLPEGPLYVILKTEVFMIKYFNGEKEVINKKEEPVRIEPVDTLKYVEDKKDNVTTVRVTYSSLGKKNDSPEYSGAIKLSPLLAIVGDFPVFYEHVLKKKVSVEGGIGITYPNIFMGGLFESNGFYENFDERKRKIGYSISTNIRLYPSYVFDEFYFGVDIKYRSYLMELESCGSTSYQDKKETISTFDSKLLIGYITDVGSSAIIEYYFSFGLRNIVFDYYDCNTSGGLTTLFKIKEENTIPHFSLGIKLGIGFERPEIPVK